MDDSLDELEAELKALRPARPAAALLGRIGCDLAAPGDECAVSVRPCYISATNLHSWKWHGWRTAGVAAVLTLAVLAGWVNFRTKDLPIAATSPDRLAAADSAARTPPLNAARSDRYQPVTASNVLYDLKDEGAVYVDGDTPARRVRYRYLDTYTWKNPRNNASLKWSVPRDEIRVLPASMN
jgi:hypothetical protein